MALSPAGVENCIINISLLYGIVSQKIEKMVVPVGTP
jgi:hypothetical protein